MLVWIAEGTTRYCVALSKCYYDTRGSEVCFTPIGMVESAVDDTPTEYRHHDALRKNEGWI